MRGIATRRLAAEVLSAYADRKVWIIEGPTVTHGGYRVVAGPLTAEQAADDPWNGQMAGLRP